MAQFDFRYWDEERRKMVYSSEWGEMSWIDIKVLADSGKLMQAIGIETVDKKPIYEGDILEVYNTYKEETSLGVVSFKHGQFVIKKFDLTSHYRWINYETRIKGNIYEDSQLLIQEKLPNE